MGSNPDILNENKAIKLVNKRKRKIMHTLLYLSLDLTVSETGHLRLLVLVG